MSATKDSVKSLVISMKELKETVAKMQKQIAEIEEDLYDGNDDPPTFAISGPPVVGTNARLSDVPGDDKPSDDG
jgi:hypothetical protein